MIENILYGLGQVFVPGSILVICIGVLAGIVFGAIPGLTTDLCVILFLPLTFAMEPMNGILILLGVYCGGMYGGSVAAVLLGTPGTNVAVATVFDGYPMAKKGNANKALQMSLAASTIGGLVSALLLLFLAPAFSKVARAFGPPEYFALAVFGISIISGISGGSLMKGLVMGCLGFCVAMIGVDDASGASRFSFGNVYMLKGLGMLPVLLGTFAIPGIFNRYRTRDYQEISADMRIRIDKSDRLTVKDVKSCLPVLIKGTAIGSFVGAVPGAGAGIAAFISYNEARRASKHPEEFGKGALEGIAAAECANNAVSGCSLIPLFTLGIPGSVVAALIVGAFTMHGLVPGPTLFRDQAPLMYAIMVGLVVCNIVMFLEGKLLLRLFYNLTKVSPKIITAGLGIFCVAGSYSFSNNMFNVYVLLSVGIIIYLLTKFGFPTAPFVLGIILGPLAEVNLKNSLVMSDGSLMIFAKRPICFGILLFTIVFTAYSMKKARSVKKEGARQTGQDEDTALED